MSKIATINGERVKLPDKPYVVEYTVKRYFANAEDAEKFAEAHQGYVGTRYYHYATRDFAGEWMWSSGVTLPDEVKE